MLVHGSYPMELFPHVNALARSNARDPQLPNTYLHLSQSQRSLFFQDLPLLGADSELSILSHASIREERKIIYRVAYNV